MEMNKIEVATVEKAVNDATSAQVNELNDLQLALVGGGIGIVIVA